MLNDEIGTYQICEAIKQKPKLKVFIRGKKISTMVNGVKYVGNLDVVSSVVNIKNIEKCNKITDNKLNVKKSDISILSDVYGISKEADWELVYDPNAVWRDCQANATKENKRKKKGNFVLNED